MKSILLPTDFSENADNAVKYAIELARLIGADITLVHTYRVYSTSGMFISVESYLKKDAAQQMLIAYEMVEKELGKERVTSKIIRGDTVSVIVNMANKGDYDLVLMGTQGASGLAEIFAGTTTSGVLKQCRKPVLAIPEGYEYHPIKNIVLAIDQMGISFSTIFAPLITIAKNAEALIRIFHKDTGQEDPGIDPSVQMFLESVEHSYHYELDTENLNQITKPNCCVWSAESAPLLRKYFTSAPPQKRCSTAPSLCLSSTM